MDSSDSVLTDPSDWKFKPFRDLDSLLRCAICFDYYQAAMILPNCSHNYCSVCIRRFLKNKSECPTCSAPTTVSQLKNNRILDNLVKQFTGSRKELMELVKGTRGRNGLRTLDFGSHPHVEVQGATVQTAESYGGAGSTTLDVIPRSAVPAVCVPQPPSLQTLGEIIAVAEQDVVKREEEGEECVQACDLTKEVVEPSTSALKSVAIAGGDSTSESSRVPKTASLGTWERSPLLPPTVSLQTPGSSATGGALHPSSSSPSPSYSPESPSILTPSERIHETCHGPQTPARPLASLPTPCRPGRPGASEAAGGSPGVGEGVSHSPAVGAKVPCPICEVLVVDRCINSHLDTCLSRTARQQAYTNPSPGCGLPKLPKLCVNILTNKQLKSKLKEYHLSTQGTRQAQIDRLKEFRLQYNAQCDSLNPKTPEQIAMEVETAEKARLSKKDSTPRPPVRRDSSEKDIEKQRASYELKHNDQFAKLIADVKKRQKRTSRPSPRSSRGWRGEEREKEGGVVAVAHGPGGNCSSDAPLGKVEEDVLVVDSSDDEMKLKPPSTPVVTVHRDVIPESPHSPRRKKSKRKCKQAVNTSGMDSSDSEEGQGGGRGAGEEWDPDFEATTPSFRHKKRRKF